jgi:hypothetical protein
MYVCMFVCMYVRSSKHVWRPEDKLQVLVFSFYLWVLGTNSGHAAGWQAPLLPDRLEISLLKKVRFYFMRMTLFLHICKCTLCVPDTRGGLKLPPDALDLELGMVWRHKDSGNWTLLLCKSSTGPQPRSHLPLQLHAFSMLFVSQSHVA